MLDSVETQLIRGLIDSIYSDNRFSEGGYLRIGAGKHKTRAMRARSRADKIAVCAHRDFSDEVIACLLSDITATVVEIACETPEHEDVWAFGYPAGKNNPAIATRICAGMAEQTDGSTFSASSPVPMGAQSMNSSGANAVQSMSSALVSMSKDAAERCDNMLEAVLRLTSDVAETRIKNAELMGQIHYLESTENSTAISQAMAALTPTLQTAAPALVTLATLHAAQKVQSTRTESPPDVVNDDCRPLVIWHCDELTLQAASLVADATKHTAGFQAAIQDPAVQLKLMQVVQYLDQLRAFVASPDAQPS